MYGFFFLVFFFKAFLILCVLFHLVKGLTQLHDTWPKIEWKIYLCNGD